ncbi:9974_t:CDS:2, partial [Ambispora gerdemannii]
MSDITEIMVFCLVLGDAIKNSFPVDIDCKMTIGHLKILIKNVKSPELDEFAPDKLNLWKVDIPQNRENQEMKIPVGVNIAKGYGGIELASFETIEEYFRPIPTSTSIRIIVQPPVTTARNLPETLEY